tara:strand:- start:218 stop:772 length:555 start_codon:yes stop_codon:yes gene_type:complete
MVNRPSVPEIITVNSEQLQAQIRDLLPSQDGFGSELQASNVITPIIDLTAAAEGSGLASNLQTALAFGSQTSFDVNNTTTTLANTPGFWRFFGSIASDANSPASTTEGSIVLSDGSTTKTILNNRNRATTSNITTTILPFDFVVWLRAGDDVQAVAGITANIVGSFRQVADSTGALVNPNGFPL